MTRDELEQFKRCMAEYTQRNIALMKECPHKVIYPNRTEIILERNQWCKDNIKGSWGGFNLGNDHVWCFKEVSDAVYFKTIWGTVTWEDLYDDGI